MSIHNENSVAQIQCVKCKNFHPFSDFTKTKKKDENGENVRRTTCKHCIYGHITTGRDKRKTHLNAIRHRSKIKNIPFNLTLEDLTIPEKCPILGISLLQEWGQSKSTPSFNSPSVDKIIPQLGYIKGNIQIISNRANIMKNDATLEDVKALLQYMEKNMPQAA